VASREFLRLLLVSTSIGWRLLIGVLALLGIRHLHHVCEGLKYKYSGRVGGVAWVLAPRIH
jgi:hypothetical protein